MSHYICVTDMVEHIVRESARIFKGTTHEHDWYFYHDALSLMTAKESVAWMKYKGYYERWILPECGLLMDQKELKRYIGRPTGDTPEIMNWDSTLNKDVHESVKQHVHATITLDKDDPRKFSLATPIQGAHAYMRVLDPETGVCPSSKRIIEDTEKAFGPSLLEIIKAQGAVVPDDRAARDGHRAAAARIGAAVVTRGGNRPRKLALDDYGDVELHQDAIAGSRIKLEAYKAANNNIV
mmetsp:Transcript_15157/g.25127  ORF Transcript_15157/g.25127 Transcript_15157/m.25127 type:complete len:238 (+) Transcript_15157:240-953(+)